MPSEYELGRAGRRKHAPLEALQVFGRDAEVFDALVDLAQRLSPERLALVERQQAADLLPALFDRLGDPVEALRALETFEPGHRGARLVSGLDRALRVGARALRHLGDDLAGHRAVGVEVLAAFRLHPFA